MHFILLEFITAWLVAAGFTFIVLLTLRGWRRPDREMRRDPFLDQLAGVNGIRLKRFVR